VALNTERLQVLAQALQAELGTRPVAFGSLTLFFAEGLVQTVEVTERAKVRAASAVDKPAGPSHTPR
jgi:hypothetical protein